MQVLSPIFSPASHCLHRLAAPIGVDPANERVALSYLYLACFSDLEARICDLDHQLEVGGAEVATWKRYKVRAQRNSSMTV